jgi:hypothetical protein
MIEHMPHFDLDLFSLESDPDFAPFLDYLEKNDELICSMITAAQFEHLEICTIIKRMSNDGLVEMTPREKDLESFSLCSPRRAENLLVSLPVAME